MDMTEERLHELENRSIEVFKVEKHTHTQKIGEENEQSLRDLLHNIKQ